MHVPTMSPTIPLHRGSAINLLITQACIVLLFSLIVVSAQNSSVCTGSGNVGQNVYARPAPGQCCRTGQNPFQCTPNGGGDSTCWPCSLGRFTNQTINTQWGCVNSSASSNPDGGYSCTFGCAPGRFAGVLGSSGCSACTAGRFQSSASQSSCNNCTAGRISSSGASLCTPCLLNQYQTSASACTACPAGSSTNGTTGATSCTLCRQNFNSGSGTNCTACSAGTFSYVCRGS